MAERLVTTKIVVQLDTNKQGHYEEFESVREAITYLISNEWTRDEVVKTFMEVNPLNA